MHASRRLNRSTSELLKLRGDVALLRRQLNSHDSIRGDKTLSEWLQDFDKKRMDLSPQAQNAIRQMGASAIPELLSLLRSSSKASGDNPGAWVITCAFGALGAKAKLAVPDLIELRQPSEPEWIRTQAASLGFIGPDAQAAIPALIAALGDKQNQNVRMNSIGALNRIGGDPSVLLPVFTASLEDPFAEVRDWAATGLGQLGDQAEMAVPNLLQALNTPNEPRLVQFVTALGQIGPTATNALPALLKLLSDSNEGVRRCATNALKRIDPEAARRAGIK